MPLRVEFCQNCSLAQLSITVDPQVLYSHYTYRTNPGSTMRQHFCELELKFLDFGIRERVLEIGSNDGSFLRHLKGPLIRRVVGIDPAKNLCDYAMDSGTETICSTFNAESATKAKVILGGHPNLIIARHVLAHIDDWNQFVADLEIVASPQTLIYVEVPYAGDTLASFQYDQAYHEHLSFISVKSIKKLLEGTRFSLASVNRFDVHGGVIGLNILCDGRPSAEPDDRITLEMWQQFGDRAKQAISELRDLVVALSNSGKRVCGYGASAKSSVWIQATGFTSKELGFIVDSTPEKIGRLSPGTDIPILSEGEFEIRKPAFALLFAWNFASEIINKNINFLATGGSFIVPVPKATVIDYASWTNKTN